MKYSFWKAILLGLVLGGGFAFALSVFGSITISPAWNYPTSTYSFQDNDIINAGDFDAVLNYLGIRSATDTVSLQGQIYNASSVANAVSSTVNITLNPVPVNRGGTGTTTATGARTNLGLGSIATHPATDYIASSTNIVNTVNGTSGAVTVSTTSTINQAVGNFNFTIATSSAGVASVTTSTSGNSSTIAFVVPANSSSSAVAVDITLQAGENLANGEAVSLLPSSSTIVESTSTTAAQATLNSTNWCGQSFPTATTTYALLSVNSTFRTPAGAWIINTEADLYASSNSAPFGSILASTTGGTSGSGAQDVLVIFNFPSPQPILTTNSRYFVVFNGANNTGATNCYYNNVSGFAGQIFATTANSGTTYSTSTSQAQDITISLTNPNGLLYGASAVNTSTRYTSFIGFATAAASQYQNVNVRVAGILASSSLAAGNEYYLANTTGTIATTPGTNSKVVGIAVSQASLLIRPSN